MIVRIFAMLVVAAPIWGQPLAEEHFDTKGNFTDSPYAYHFEGAYHIYDVDGRWSMDTKRAFKDFLAVIRTEFMGGASNYGYGIIFRGKDLRNFYEFRISGNGQYGMGMYVDKSWTRILPWKEHTAIRTEGINYLGVEAVGPRFVLFVNGVALDTVEHSKYTEGHIGLVAYDSVHAHFDDLRVFPAGTSPSSNFDFTPSARMTEKDYDYSADVTFMDNFIDHSNHWGESGGAYYESGSYTVYDESSDHYSTQSVSCRDVELEVNFRVFEWSKEGLAGIIFGLSDDDNYALLTISETGMASAQRKTYGSRYNLLPPTAVPGFDKNAVQTLTIRIRQPVLHFTVNGHDLGEFSDERGYYSTADRVGLYAGRSTRANFLSIRARPLPFSWAAFANDTARSPGVWFCTLSSLGVVLLIVFVRRRKHAARRKKLDQEVFDLIKSSHGVLRLGPVMAKYRVTRKEAQAILDDVASKYGGQAVLETDGGITYEFPDFMPSEEKVQADIISFAAMRKGRLTVTDTANFLKKDLVETETLLDKMVDGRRVRKTDTGGVVYYEFPEIMQAKK